MQDYSYRYLFCITCISFLSPFLPAHFSGVKVLKTAMPEMIIVWLCGIEQIKDSGRKSGPKPLYGPTFTLNAKFLLLSTIETR
jgi:hypothetical protein